MEKTDLKIFSSEQWFSALDTCNREAISVMLTSTSLVEHYASQLINYQLMHKKKNISYRYSWRDNISNLIAFCGNPTLKGFLDLHICRDYVFYMIDNFDKLTVDFRSVLFNAIKNRRERLSKYNMEMETFYNRIGFHGDNDLLFVINHISFLKKEYLNIRGLLIKNYKDYAMSKAMADYNNLNQYRNVSVEDMRQNYVLPILKAINKYDVDKGSFKNYLDIWIRKYREDQAHFLGESSSQNNGVKDGDFLSIDSEAAQESFQESQTVTEDSVVDIVNENRRRVIIENLAALVDPKGYARDFLELGKYT